MGSAAGLILIVLASSHAAGSAALAVYALSFWHYLFYWWAYRHGAVPPRRFRRDAVLMKSVALLALASVALALPWHAGATAVASAGFLLNAAAARTLGPARTYYGWELGDVSHERITAFPYSLVPHPMLLGNLVAYAGTLLSPEFRTGWWPLAAGHIALNLGLLLMEKVVTPRRRRAAATLRTSSFAPLAWLGAPVVPVLLATALGGAAGFAAATALGWGAGRGPCVAVAASAAAFAVVSAGRYLAPGDAAFYRHSTPVREVP